MRPARIRAVTGFRDSAHRSPARCRRPGAGGALARSRYRDSRNRFLDSTPHPVNGRIIGRDAGGIRVAVAQSFGNCPQYIQRRTLASPRPIRGRPHRPRSEASSNWMARAHAAIAAADTFFVASRSRAGNGALYGADISHRGGRPGFIRVDGDVLTIPDFAATATSTRSAICSPSRARPCCSSISRPAPAAIQGSADVDWNGATRRALRGAERLWRFHVSRGWRRRAAAPLRWSFVDYSRTTLANRGLAACYRYRAMSLSSAARPGESFSNGMLLSGTSAVRFEIVKLGRIRLIDVDEPRHVLVLLELGFDVVVRRRAIRGIVGRIELAQHHAAAVMQSSPESISPAA